VSQATIGDVLRALDEHLFVGREREVEMFLAWLLDESPMPSILNVSGRGGVGKSVLLAAFRRVAEDLGRTVVLIDGHDLQPEPEAFLACLAEALALPSAELDQIVATVNWTLPVLMVDTFEQLGGLTRYLQDTLLPRLATGVRLVIVGRRPLGRAWSRDALWRTLIKPLTLNGFTQAESRAYLVRRGVADERLVPEIAAATAGYPLALSLAADLVVQHGVKNFSAAPAWRLAVRNLVERLLLYVADPGLVELIEVTALIRHFDQAILEAVTERKNVGDTFARLCQLSVVQPAQRGLMMHDDVRRIIADDLRWRRPDRYADLRQRALRYYRERMPSASAEERHWLLGERLYLWEDGLIRALLFEDHEPGQVWIEPLRDEDVPEVLAAWPHFLRTILATAGGTLEQLTEGADPQFLRQVAEFFDLALRHPAAWRRVARDREGTLTGFTVHLPVCGATFPLFERHPAFGPFLTSYFTPEELRSLPADPEHAEIWWLVSVAYSDVDLAATRAALMRDSLGLFTRGGVYIGITPLDTMKQLLEALGFERVLEGRSYAWGKGSPTDSYVLDLRQIGVERWIEAIMAGRRVPKPLRQADIECELRELLPLWSDDARLGQSALAGSTLVDAAVRVAERPAAIRAVVERVLAEAQARVSEDQALALRAVKVAYLTPGRAPQRADLADALAVSRRTLYRLLERGTALLACGLAALSPLT